MGCALQGLIILLRRPTVRLVEEVQKRESFTYGTPESLVALSIPHLCSGRDVLRQLSTAGSLSEH
jgi:hypothetical protein